MAFLQPIMRLKRVDLPTFGRPTMATMGRATGQLDGLEGLRCDQLGPNGAIQDLGCDQLGPNGDIHDPGWAGQTTSSGSEWNGPPSFSATKALASTGWP